MYWEFHVGYIFKWQSFGFIGLHILYSMKLISLISFFWPFLCGDWKTKNYMYGLSSIYRTKPMLICLPGLCRMLKRKFFWWPSYYIWVVHCIMSTLRWFQLESKVECHQSRYTLSRYSLQGEQCRRLCGSSIYAHIPLCINKICALWRLPHTT